MNATSMAAERKGASVDYNTERKRLILPEFGRCVQQMAEHAKSIADRAERQQCARTIVALMAGMTDRHGDERDLQQKLWNYLAAMANYELDIDYPVEIERIDETRNAHEQIPYPQQRIAKRHYGAIAERMAGKIAETEDDGARHALAQMVANQMKRNLARWNRDALSDEKVLDDLAALTGGKVSLALGDMRLKSDGEVLADVQQPTYGKKKKKK